MTVGLTRRQSDLLSFIRATMSANGIPPTFDEMRDAVGQKSKSGVHRILVALEERGHIRRMPGRARAIELIDARTAVVNPEIAAGVRDYARSQLITFDTAVNELLRMSVGPHA